VAQADHPGNARREERKTARILLVEDEEAILLPMARYFRGRGCAVDLAQEPEGAIALLAERPYGLVILDLWLTRFGHADGLEVLRDIRRRGEGPEVLVLTGRLSREARSEALRLGAGAVLRKPQTLAHLAETAFGLMERR
jgi:DNA-binding response OmpR family regulator